MGDDDTERFSFLSWVGDDGCGAVPDDASVACRPVAGFPVVDDGEWAFDLEADGRVPADDVEFSPLVRAVEVKSIAFNPEMHRDDVRGVVVSEREPADLGGLDNRLELLWVSDCFFLTSNHVV